MTNPPSRKIMIALDGSPHSMYTLEWYNDVFAKHRDELYLYHCKEPDTKGKVYDPNANPNAQDRKLGYIERVSRAARHSMGQSSGRSSVNPTTKQPTPTRASRHGLDRPGSTANRTPPYSKISAATSRTRHPNPNTNNKADEREEPPLIWDSDKVVEYIDWFATTSRYKTLVVKDVVGPSPGKAIVQVTEKYKIDIILIGSQGWGTMQHFGVNSHRVGTVCDFVMENSKLPILVCQLADR